MDVWVQEEGIDWQLQVFNDMNIALPAIETTVVGQSYADAFVKYVSTVHHWDLDPASEHLIKLGRRLADYELMLVWKRGENGRFDTTWAPWPAGQPEPTNPIFTPLPPRWARVFRQNKNYPNFNAETKPYSAAISSFYRITADPLLTNFPDIFPNHNPNRAPNQPPPPPAHASRANKISTPGMFPTNFLKWENIAWKGQRPWTALPATKITTTWVPCRRVAVTSTRCDDLLAASPPTSPAFAGLSATISSSTDGQRIPSMARGVVLRDGASLIGLVRTVLAGRDNWKDVAAIARVLLMGMSTEVQLHSSDNTVLRFVADASYLTTTLTISARGATQAYTNFTGYIAAVPLDTALAIAQNRIPMDANVMNARWFYPKLDEKFTMVPVSSQMLSSPYIVPYITAFLTHRYWYGRVTHQTQVADIGDYTHNTFFGIPQCNLAEIEGPNDVMIVLVDITSADAPTNVTIKGNQIPVYRGDRAPAAAYAGASWTAIFDAWFTTATMDRVSYDCAYAFQQICAKVATDDTCGRGIVLAAELSCGHTPGKLVEQNFDGSPAREAPNVMGAWTIGAPTPWIPGTTWTGRQFPTAATPNNLLNGFNAAHLTPFHRPISAACELVLDAATNNALAGEPKGYFQHRAYSATSAMRLSSFLGLLTTHQQAYTLESGCGASVFVSMVATGLSLSTADTLLLTDVGTRAWVGLDSEYNVVARDQLEHFVDEWTAHHTNWIDTQNFEESPEAWSQNTWEHLNQYWVTQDAARVTDNINWCTTSPVPVVSAIQWLEKMGVVIPPPSPKFEMRLGIERDQISAFSLISSPSYKALAYSSTDLPRSRPRTWVKIPGYAPSSLGLWAESWDRVTSGPLQPANIPRSPTFHITTNLFTLSYTNTQYVTNDPVVQLWNGTPAITSPGPETTLRTSSIQFPDPPSATDFLRQTYRYIVDPAAHAAIGYLTGGPAGAVVGGGAALAKTALSDIKDAVSRPSTSQTQTESPPAHTSTPVPTPVPPTSATPDPPSLSTPSNPVIPD